MANNQVIHPARTWNCEWASWRGLRPANRRARYVANCILSLSRRTASDIRFTVAMREASRLVRYSSSDGGSAAALCRSCGVTYDEQPLPTRHPAANNFSGLQFPWLLQSTLAKRRWAAAVQDAIATTCALGCQARFNKIRRPKPAAGGILSHTPVPPTKKLSTWT